MVSSEQRVIAITGARKGIGRALSEHYLQEGARVIGCSRSESDLSHADYTHYQVDVANESDVKKMFSGIRKTFGRLDALVNNAGIASMNHVLLTPVSTVNKIFDTNVVGTFVCMREAIKLMKRQTHGRIVNMATVADPLKLEGEAAYAASKAAVVKLTEITAREVADMGITVNAIGPTPIQTDLIRSVSKEKIDSLLQRQAIHRLGEYRDVINVVDFFLRDESDFITGQTIYLGGV